MRDQGWAVAEGVESGENLIKLINGGGIKGSSRSWRGAFDGSGDHPGTRAAEPGQDRGNLPQCGALADFDRPRNGHDVLYTWKTLIDPRSRVANYAPGQAGYATGSRRSARIRTLDAVAPVRRRVSSAAIRSRLPICWPA